MLTVLAELGTVNVRRAYGNWSKPSLKGWSAILHQYAIEPQQQFDVTKGKNATDMKMTIDAMDLLFGGRVTRFRHHVERQRFRAAGHAYPAGRPAGLWLRRGQDAGIVPAGLHALHRCRRH